MAKNPWKPDLSSSFKRFQQAWKQDPLVQVGLFLVVAFLIGLMLGFLIGRSSVAPEEPVIAEEPEAVEVAPEPEPKPAPTSKGNDRLWKLTGTNLQIIGAYGDNVQWDGANIKEMPGEIEVNLDPENDIGKITVEFIGAINPEDRTILDGRIEIEFKIFNEEEDYMKGGIREDINLFGNTDREGDYLPTTHAFVAAWGTARLRLNKQNVYDNLKAIFLYTEGTRRFDGKIKTETNKLYAPKFKGEPGFTDSDDREIHLILYEDYEDHKNYPRKAVFIYLLFEDTELVEAPEGAKT